MTPLLVFHLVGSLVVGYAGRHRRIGFVGFVILSLLITPVLALLALWMSAPSSRQPR